MSFCVRARETGWCGRCYDGVRGRAYHPGHWGYKTPRKCRKERAVKYCRVPVRGGAAGGTGEAHADPDLAGRCPAVEEFLRVAATEDGKVRRTGTILVFTEAGLWKACLSDRESGHIAFVAAGSFGTLWDAAEACLQGDGADWRPGRNLAGRR